jgi:FtsP/CotA-like multicopper oxidase with cupredoxin domain
MKTFSRRDFLKVGGLALAGAAGATAAVQNPPAVSPKPHHQDGMQHGDGHGGGPGTGDVNHELNGFNPSEILTDFDYGTVSTLPGGQTLREYEFVVINKDIEVVPGIMFPAWTYNGRIPGPTIRATEGDRIRIKFFNGSNHPHTMHFHGFHPGAMDGVPGTGPGGNVEPGQEFIYEFDAEPFGLHLYHCHSFPARAPHRERSVRRLHRRPEDGPAAGRPRDGDGDARL